MRVLCKVINFSLQSFEINLYTEYMKSDNIQFNIIISILEFCKKDRLFFHIRCLWTIIDTSLYATDLIFLAKVNFLLELV